jgi:RNA polymerase sigma-70 factor (ECF subfamily)
MVSHRMEGGSPDWAGWFPAEQTRSVDDLTVLARAAAEGDPVATAAFVRRTQPEVWRVCARLGDRADADDLTQEVYLRALPALARFRGDASARTWLLQITRHVCADHVRRRTRRRALLERVVQRTTAGDAVEAARTGELELDEAIESLADERREAFVLTQVAGLSYAEAAVVCEVPIGTIRSRVARARADLLTSLAGVKVDGGEGDAAHA